MSLLFRHKVSYTDEEAFREQVEHFRIIYPHMEVTHRPASGGYKRAVIEILDDNVMTIAKQRSGRYNAQSK